MATPQFIECDLQKIIQELILAYETKTGRTLQPAQAEMLILDSMAYREMLIRQGIQNAALQNLVEFSTFPALDFLGALVGVTRKGSSPATTTIRFTFVTPHGPNVIPMGTRIQSTDGKICFTTDGPVDVLPTDPWKDVPCTSTTDGVSGNDYIPGSVTRLIDPLVFVTSVANTTTSAQGSDLEQDDGFRDRIKLAPESFSTAGPKGAYIFHAKTVSPDIVDVAVTSPDPGVVKIWPLMNDGDVTPTEILTAVLAACSAEKVRPLCDTVLAASPVKIEYAIVMNLVLLTTADQDQVLDQVQVNLDALVKNRFTHLGLDVLESQVMAAAMVVPGVWNATLVGWSDVTIDATEFASCTGITVTVTGTTEG